MYTIASKGDRIYEENFLRYLDLCCVNPVCHKLKIFPLLYAVGQSELKVQDIVLILHILGGGYFAVVGIIIM